MSPPSALGKPTKACATCNHRKLKCDAAIVGLPCSRCITKGYPETCALANRRRRKSAIRASDRHQALDHAEARPVRDVETKSTDQLSESRLSQDGRVPLSSWDLIDDREGIHYMSILGRLARNEPVCTTNISEPTIAGNRLEKENGRETRTKLSQAIRFDTADREYLHQRGAFTLPTQPCCETMLRQHFIFVYPHMPVFDYVDFVDSYLSGSFSWFMMQAILASAVPYTTLDILAECGFKSRLTALEFFFNNAVKLYDFGCEESQLVKLQGSLILSTVLVSYTIDKDFRFWHHNAVRLANRLGLHKSHVIEEKGPVLKDLYRKIWSLICCRDIVFSIIHLEAPRVLGSSKQQAPETEWWDKHIPSTHASVLPSWTEGQKCYSSEHMKLAIIATRWQDALSTLDNGQSQINQTIDEEISRSFANWRQSLPSAIQSYHNGLKTTGDEIWTATLMASCYRFECIFYRLLLIRSPAAHQLKDRLHILKQRLRTAIFELDTIVSRLMVTNMLTFANLNLLGCVACLLALHIETVLDSNESANTKSLTITYIRRSELALQQICNTVPAMECNLRLLHRFLDQKELYAASALDMASAESQPSGRIQGQEEHQLGHTIHDFVQSSTNDAEPQIDLLNSSILIHDEAPEALGDMNDWLDGLVWLDYLKDSHIMPG